MTVCNSAPLKVAGFLSEWALAEISTSLTASEIVLAHSWRDVNVLLQNPAMQAFVFDLYADSSLDTQAALRILKQHPCVPSIALIRDSPYNVEALVELSRNGLWEVVCASDPSADLARVIREQVASAIDLIIQQARLRDG